jgi:DNA-directed RNA polymerase subunit RPC12/RpoP
VFPLDGQVDKWKWFNMGTKLLVGVNDLETVNPHLAKQWVEDLNLPLTPRDLTAGSGKEIWWKCDKNHSWQATPSTRSKGVGCPYCSNQKAWSGYNDLATLFPQLATEWNYAKNSPITPKEIVAGTNKKYWWTCPLGHEYEASVHQRSSRKSGCPYCSNQFLLKGFNDLQTTNPDLAAQWHKSKNANKKATDVIEGTNTKYWWQCSLGHEWMQSPKIRSGGNGCPFCAHQKLWTGFNDLKTVNPKLAAQWNTAKNGIEPSGIMTGAKFLAWWKCDQGHEWQSQLRGRKDGNCSICLNRTLLEGFNDLETKKPELAKQWHPLKNGNLLPSQIVFNSRGRKCWWVCNEGHEWEATLASRNLGNGCPVCSRQLLVAGVNDMATTNPEMAATFDFERNSPITPDQIMAGTAKSFWWKCDQGHSWKAASNSRFYGRGCPTCAEYGFKPDRPAIFYFIENSSLSARKIGITNLDRNNTRLSGFAKLGWKEILTIENENGSIIQAIEKDVLTWIRNELQMPIYLTAKEMGRQGGWTETFSLEGISNQQILSKISASKKKHFMD